MVDPAEEGEVCEASTMDFALRLPSRGKCCLAVQCHPAKLEQMHDLLTQQPILGTELSDICQVIEAEVVRLCSSSSFYSVFQQFSKESLMALNWSAIISE